MQSPPSNNGSYLTQFIELHQYLKGSFYNEVGLNANFNMKRESLGDGETSLNEDSLLPLCDEMLRCRQEDIQKVNEMFGTDITVEFDSSWAQNIIEKELALDKMKAEASQLAEEPEEPDEASQLAEEPEEPDEASQLAKEPEESDEVSQLAEEPEEKPQIEITIINNVNEDVDESEEGDDDDEREVSAS